MVKLVFCSAGLNLPLLALRQNGRTLWVQTQVEAMKAKSYLLAISLAANLVLGWMLWQRHPATNPDSEPALVQTMPSEEERLPLPATSMPLTASPLLPLMGAALPEPGQSSAADS